MKSNTLNVFIKSILAGVMIAVGTIAYVNCPPLLGALIFSVGLLAILQLKLSLYTGLVPYAERWTSIPFLLTVLAGNLVGCCTMFAYPSSVAQQAVAAKMSETLLHTFIDACLCGILIYVAVEAFKNERILIVIASVFGFIVCGFEHSIANACFLISARRFDAMAMGYLLCTVLGNAVGAVLFRRGTELKYANSKDRKRLVE